MMRVACMSGLAAGVKSYRHPDTSTRQGFLVYLVYQYVAPVHRINVLLVGIDSIIINTTEYYSNRW